MVQPPDESVTEKDAEEGAPGSALGRVESDGRGRNVWRWASHLVESTSVLLKRLQSSELELEATQKLKGRIEQKAAAKKDGRNDDPWSVGRGPGDRDAGGGFDPYNSR